GHGGQRRPVVGTSEPKAHRRLFGDIGGIVASDGEVWREYRRFTLKTLRDFGFGRRGAEEIIAVEAEHLRQTLDEAAGKPVETSVLLSTVTSNIICQLVFGSRLASEDEKFGEILEVFRKITHNEDTNSANAMFLTLMPVIERFPFIADLLFKTPASKAAIDDFLRLQSYCNEQRDRHIAEMEGVDRARDYIEAHLLYQRDQPEMFNNTRLTMAVSDLFVAGTDTTANTLRWAILYMIDNPDVCEKVHKEVVKAIGNDRLPLCRTKQHCRTLRLGENCQ
uniref:CP2G1 protein n=1 Tax=Macrostomum lignano TaxID=282301 RepID=A0A1I8G5E9_9PLAT